MAAAAAAVGSVLLAILAFVIRISFQMGGLVRGFNDHVKTSDATDEDHERRIRSLEARPAPSRPRRA